MESSGFKVALFSYKSIVNAFNGIGIDVHFDENTSDAVFKQVVAKIENLKTDKRKKLKDSLISFNTKLLSKFFTQLKITLDRQIDELILIPLYGNSYSFSTIDELNKFIDNYIVDKTYLKFNSYRIIVIYSNEDKIEASFHDKDDLAKFLAYISN
jgi:hypothetical protein